MTGAPAATSPDDASAESYPTDGDGCGRVVTNETAADILSVYYGVALTLKLISESVERDNPPENLTQDAVDDLEAAFQVGERLRSADAYDRFLSDGLEALPDALAADVSEALAPLAPAYGVDLDTSATTDTSALETTVSSLRTAVGRRGS